MVKTKRYFVFFFFFFKQKTAYEIGTGDWSSDVCLPISAGMLGQLADAVRHANRTAKVGQA